MLSHVSSDILILSSPLTQTQQPMNAGAVLKSVANKAGYSCVTVDLNKIIVNWINSDLSLVLMKKYFNNGSTEGVEQKYIDRFVSMVLEIVIKHDPKILGISVFTDSSRVATKVIAQAIRQHFPKIKIIIGGAGIVNVDAEDSSNHPVSLPGQVSFAEKLLQNNLIDYYIQGDAEHAFYQFLKNNYDFAGINQSAWHQLTNDQLLELEYPDYSDYDWSLYEKRVIGITGSRGCVRQCRFCDYIVAWKNYTWRTADHIFEEMLYQKNLYNIMSFHFSDSLINGNMAEYRRLVTLLSEYNSRNPDIPFRWGSFLIIKSPTQFDDELWRLTAASGCELLMIGLETFVEQIRFDMNKKFTNQDVEFCIEKIAKYNIPVMFLVFIGYPTETQQHIEQSIKWLEDHQHLRQHFELFFNETMFLLPGSWVEQNKHVYQIKLVDSTNALTWVSPDSTLEIRQQRSQLVRDTAKLLGYTVISQDDDQDPHRQIEEGLARLLQNSKVPKL